MSERAEKLKELLNLRQHEGPSCSAGCFKETYTCEDAVAVNIKRYHSSAKRASVDAADYDDIFLPKGAFPNRFLTAATAIYFMLQGAGYTTWQMHVGHDEILLHHEGECVKVHTITQTGNYKCQLLGSPVDHEGALPQVTIPRYTWMANELANKALSSYALTSAFVVPGYDATDARVANIEELVKKFPVLKDILLKFAPAAD